jgi:hypothetical protein
MPRIFDNIEQHFSPALGNTLAVSYRADFCVGYFNVRGRRNVAGYVDKWPDGEDHCCRLMIGVQNTPQGELRGALSLSQGDNGMGNSTAVRLKRKLALEFHRQVQGRGVGFQHQLRYQDSDGAGGGGRIAGRGKPL